MLLYRLTLTWSWGTNLGRDEGVSITQCNDTITVVDNDMCIHSYKNFVMLMLFEKILPDILLRTIMKTRSTFSRLDSVEDIALLQYVLD